MECERTQADVSGMLGSRGNAQLRTLSSSVESVGTGSRWSVRRLVLCSFGTVALVGCAIVTFPSSQTVSDNGGIISARTLLDHPSVHAVASDNILSLSTVEDPQEVSSLRTRTADNMQSIGNIIDTQFPEFSKHLRSVPITQEQTTAVLRALEHTRDTRLQLLGLSVAHVIRDANTTDPAVLRSLVKKSLSSRKQELKPLVEEMVVDSLATPSSPGSGISNELLECRIELLKTASDSWAAVLRNQARSPIKKRSFERRLLEKEQLTEAEKMRTSQQVIGSIGVASEEVMAIFRIIRPIAALFGKDLEIPPLVISILGALDFALEVTSCALGKSSRGEPIKSITCPILFASAGFDALREIAVMMGYLHNDSQ
jgi:hypothetical protein